MVKYRSEFKSLKGHQWRVDISHQGYEGEPIEFAIASGSDAVITWDYDVETAFADSPFMPATASLTPVNEGQFDIKGLQEAEDFEFLVEIYKDEGLVFEGYIQADSVERPIDNTPYAFSLKAIDALGLLDGLRYAPGHTLPAGDAFATFCPFNYVRTILRSERFVNSSMPIRWALPYTTAQAGMGRPWAGEVEWNNRGLGLWDDEDVYRSVTCGFIVKNLSKAFGFRVFQHAGYWYFVHPAVQIDGEVNMLEVAEAESEPTIVTVQAGGLIDLDSRQITPGTGRVQIRPAIRKVACTYEPETPENALPNGSFELELLGYPLYWQHSPGLSVVSTEGLVRDSESAVRLVDIGGNAPVDGYYFMPEGRLPLDGNRLFETFQFGFTFMPEFGWPLSPDATDEIPLINWDSSPLEIAVSYSDGGSAPAYLNEFGYWTRNTELATAKAYVTISTRDGTRYARLAWLGRVGPGSVFHWYGTFTVEWDDYAEGNTVPGITDPVYQAFVNAGYTINDAGVSFIEVVISPNAVLPEGGAYFEHDPRISGRIPISVEGLAVGDIASVDFTGSGSLDVKLPDPGPLPNGGEGRLNIVFYVKRNMGYRLDDVYIKLIDRNDRFVAMEYSGDEVGIERDHVLEVSSEFSGHRPNSLHTEPFTSHQETLYTYGHVTSTLTGLYALSSLAFSRGPSPVLDVQAIASGDLGPLQVYEFDSVASGRFIPLRYELAAGADTINMTILRGRTGVPANIGVENVTTKN